MNGLFKLFLIFFKIGAFTFGGGYAMLPIIYREYYSSSRNGGNRRSFAGDAGSLGC